MGAGLVGDTEGSGVAAPPAPVGDGADREGRELPSKSMIATKHRTRKSGK